VQDQKLATASASKLGLSTMRCVFTFYRRRPSLAVTLVALSEIGLVGSSLDEDIHSNVNW